MITLNNIFMKYKNLNFFYFLQYIIMYVLNIENAIKKNGKKS